MENEEIDSSQWVTFDLGKEVYAVSVLDVQEILKESEVSPVPGSPSYVMGIINLRGKVITLIDARIKLGMKPIPDEAKSRIIVLDNNDHNIGMMVDSVKEVLTLQNSDIEAAPKIGSDEKAKFIKGVCNHNKELIILIDSEKLLNG